LSTATGEVLSDLDSGWSVSPELLPRLPCPVQRRVSPATRRAIASRDIPDYHVLIQSALQRLGWSDKVFDLIRIRVEFPIVPSVVLTAFSLAMTPAQMPVREPSK